MPLGGLTACRRNYSAADIGGDGDLMSDSHSASLSPSCSPSHSTFSSSPSSAIMSDDDASCDGLRRGFLRENDVMPNKTRRRHSLLTATRKPEKKDKKCKKNKKSRNPKRTRSLVLPQSQSQALDRLLVSSGSSFDGVESADGLFDGELNSQSSSMSDVVVAKYKKEKKKRRTSKISRSNGNSKSRSKSKSKSKSNAKVKPDLSLLLAQFSASSEESDDASGCGGTQLSSDSNADDARTGFDDMGSVAQDFYDTRRPGASGREGSESDWWHSSVYESDGSYTMSSAFSLSGSETEGEFEDVVVVDEEIAPMPAPVTGSTLATGEETPHSPSFLAVDEHEQLEDVTTRPQDDEVLPISESYDGDKATVMPSASPLPTSKPAADTSIACKRIPSRAHHFIHYRHRSEEDLDLCADPEHYSWVIEKVLAHRQVPIAPKPSSRTFVQPASTCEPLMRDEYLVKWKNRSFLHLDWIPGHRLRADKAGERKAERIGEAEVEYMENMGGYPTSVDRVLASRTSERVGLWRTQRRTIAQYKTPGPVLSESSSSDNEVAVADEAAAGQQLAKPARPAPPLVSRTRIRVHTAVALRRKPERRFLVKWHLLGYDEVSWEWESDLRKQPNFLGALRRYMLWRNDPGCVGVGRVKNLVVRDKASTESDADAIWLHARQMKCQKRSTRTGKPARCTPIPRQPRAFRPLPAYAVNRLIPGDRELRSYQVEGVNWMLHCWEQGRNVILADEMGLGKTAQTLSLLWQLFQRHHLHGPFLIVVPLSVVAHWKRECEDWTDMNGVLYHGNADARKAIRRYEFFYDHDLPKTQRKDKLGTAKKASKLGHQRRCKFHCLITTYETVVQDIAALRSIPWKFLVVDEAHRLKNPRAKLAQHLKTLRFESFLALTGTPIQNNTLELWSLLSFVAPEVVGSSPDEFLKQFGDMKDSSQVEALHELLKPILLRRLKEDVDTSIAAKEETVIEVELTWLQKQYYRAILERNYSFLAKGATGVNAPNLANVVMELRKCCNHPYLIRGVEEAAIVSSRLRTPGQMNDHLIACCGKLVLIDKLLPKLQAEGHRVLLFSQMVRLLDIVEDYLKYRGYIYERLDGNIRGTARQSAIDRFTGSKTTQPGRTNAKSEPFVFLLSTRAGGLGINLTAADTVIIFDSDWNPQNDLQAQARAHRIGQTKEVRVYRLITRNTYEQTMFNAASRKLGLDHAVLTLETEQEASVAAANAKSGLELDDKTVDQLKEGKGARALSKTVIDQLLKHGVYDLLGDGAEAASKSFCEADVDQILKKRSTTTRQEAGESRGLHAFSKATFAVGSDQAAEVDVHDPDFWSKLLPTAKETSDGDQSAQQTLQRDDGFEQRRRLLEGTPEPAVDIEALKAGRKERAHRQLQLDRTKGSDHDDDDDDFAADDVSVSDESMSDADESELPRRPVSRVSPPLFMPWTMYERTRILRSLIDFGFGRPHVIGVRASLLRPDIFVHTLLTQIGFPSLPSEIDPFRLPSAKPGIRGRLFRQTPETVLLFSVSYLRKMLQVGADVPRPTTMSVESSKSDDPSKLSCPILLADFTKVVSLIDSAFLSQTNEVVDVSHAVWPDKQAPSAAFANDPSFRGDKASTSIRNNAKSQIIYLEFLARARSWASESAGHISQRIAEEKVARTQTLVQSLFSKNIAVPFDLISVALSVDVLDSDLTTEEANLSLQEERASELHNALQASPADDCEATRSLQMSILLHSCVAIPTCRARVELIRFARKQLLDDLTDRVHRNTWLVHDAHMSRTSPSAFASHGRAIASWWEPQHDAGLILAVLWHPHPFAQINQHSAQAEAVVNLLAAVQSDVTLPFAATKLTFENLNNSNTEALNTPQRAVGHVPAEIHDAPDRAVVSSAEVAQFVMPASNALLKRARSVLKKLDSFRARQERAQAKASRRLRKKAARSANTQQNEERPSSVEPTVSSAAAGSDYTRASVEPAAGLRLDFVTIGETFSAGHKRNQQPAGRDLFEAVHANLRAAVSPSGEPLHFVSAPMPKQAYEPPTMLLRQRAWHLLLLQRCIEQFQSFDDFSVVGPWSTEERSRMMDTLVSFGLPQLSDGEVFARDAADISAVDWKAFRCRSLLAARQSSDCRTQLESVLSVADANISFRLSLFWELRNKCLPGVIRWAIEHDLGGLPMISGGRLVNARSIEHACALAGQTGLFLGPDSTCMLIARLEQLLRSHLRACASTAFELRTVLDDMTGFPAWWQSPRHDAALLVGISKYGFVCSPSRFARGLDYRSVALAATIAVREHQIPLDPADSVLQLNLLPSERPPDQYGRGGWADILADSSLPFVSVFNSFHNDLRQQISAAGSAGTVTVVDVITRMQLPDEHVIGSRVRRLTRAILALLDCEKESQSMPIQSGSSKNDVKFTPSFSPTVPSAKAHTQHASDEAGLPQPFATSNLRRVCAKPLGAGGSCEGLLDVKGKCEICSQRLFEEKPQASFPSSSATVTQLPSLLFMLERDSAGSIKWPLQLQRDLLVAQLGSISTADTFHTSSHIFPLGYKALRHMAACSTEAYERCIQAGLSLENATQWFVMEIIANHDAMCMFRVTPAPLPNIGANTANLSSTSSRLRELESQPVVGYDATKVWVMMMQRVAHSRMRILAQLQESSDSASLIPSLPELPDSSTTDGLETFGLNHNVIQELVQDLPGSEGCVRYVRKRFLQTDGREGNRPSFPPEVIELD